MEAVSTGDRRDRQRLTVPEAATVLGVTVDAVRGRMRRGKIASEHDEQGKVYVWIDAPAADGSRPTPTVEEPSAASRRPSNDQALVEALREQVAYLRGVIDTRDRELALRADEVRRRDSALEREQELAAMFADRLRQLEAPRDEPHGPEIVTDEEGSTSTSEAPTERETASSQGAAPERRASWWRRFFGFDDRGGG